MIVVGLLSAALVGMAPAAQTADTVQAAEQVVRAYRQHLYHVHNNLLYSGMGGQELRDYLGPACSADDGTECWGGDWVAAFCRPDRMCNEDPGPLVATTRLAALASPESGYVTGQAVFALTRFGRLGEAMEVVENCAAASWWCDALRGYVLQQAGRLDEAESRYRSFVAAAPDSIACFVTEPGSLIGGWDLDTPTLLLPTRLRRRIDLACETGTDWPARAWWMADPLYIVEGNDRWVEHVGRALEARWYFESRESRGQYVRVAYDDANDARIKRRGPWDSYELLTHFSNGGVRSRTSFGAARYHFMPDFADDDGYLEHPTWRLEATRDDEGYTPPYGAFHRLPLQVARFRQRGDGDSLRIATAGLTTGTPLDGAAPSAYLVLSDAPDRFPLQLEAPFYEGRAVFLPQAPAERTIVSFEVLSEAGIGRHRLTLDPLDVEGPGLSDLLLYRAGENPAPDSLLAAAAVMLGTTAITQPAGVGLYWEIYGFEAGETVAFELEVERRSPDGGLLPTIRRLLPGGAEEAEAGRLTWSEPLPGPHAAQAVILDLGEAEPGGYAIVLRARWGGDSVVETRREVEIGGV